MRAKEFTVEAEVKPYKYNPMELDQAVSTLNHHCTEALGMIHNPLWRGMRNHNEPIILIDPSTGKRQSNNTSNYYTQLIDHSPYFKEFPKRSKSLICSTAYSYASGYKYGGNGGAAYAIFPYDGVSIAMCPQRDMWETSFSIPELGMDFDEDSGMRQFNDWMKNTMMLPETYSGILKTINNPGWAQMVIEHAKNDYSWMEGLTNKTKKFILEPDGPSRFMSVVMAAMAPQHTGFRLLSIPQFIDEKPNKKECWVGGPVVAIREDIWKHFASAVNDKDAPGRPQVGPASINDPSAKRSSPTGSQKQIILPAKYYQGPKDEKTPEPSKKERDEILKAKIAKDEEDDGDRILRMLGVK